MYVEGPIIYAASPRQVRRAEVLLEKLAGMNLRGCPRGLQLAAKAKPPKPAKPVEADVQRQ